MWWQMLFGVPKFTMPLTAQFDHMGVSLCYVGTSREETKLLIQSSLLERVCDAQQYDHLIQEVCKIIGDGKPQDLPSMKMMWFI